MGPSAPDRSGASSRVVTCERRAVVDEAAGGAESGFPRNAAAFAWDKVRTPIVLEERGMCAAVIVTVAAPGTDELATSLTRGFLAREST